jgi:hypothetical protein
VSTEHQLSLRVHATFWKPYEASTPKPQDVRDRPYDAVVERRPYPRCSHARTGHLKLQTHARPSEEGTARGGEFVSRRFRRARGSGGHLIRTRLRETRRHLPTPPGAGARASPPLAARSKNFVPNSSTSSTVMPSSMAISSKFIPLARHWRYCCSSSVSRMIHLRCCAYNAFGGEPDPGASGSARRSCCSSMQPRPP